jgi:hypothetical protein
MKLAKHRVMYVIMALVFGAFLLHYISYWGDGGVRREAQHPGALW